MPQARQPGSPPTGGVHDQAAGPVRKPVQQTVGDVSHAAPVTPCPALRRKRTQEVDCCVISVSVAELHQCVRHCPCKASSLGAALKALLGTGGQSTWGGVAGRLLCNIHRNHRLLSCSDLGAHPLRRRHPIASRRQKIAGPPVLLLLPPAATPQIVVWKASKGPRVRLQRHPQATTVWHRHQTQIQMYWSCLGLSCQSVSWRPSTEQRGSGVQ